MSALILDQTNRRELISELISSLDADRWIVACLCADWCDVCKQYQSAFHGLADAAAEACFVWIDIEDHADLVGDLDVENFPTLLIQRGDKVYFFGAVLPDIGIADRLVSSYREQSATESPSSGATNPLRVRWQQECNLRTLLESAL
jgi:thioredoxin 1